MRCFCCDLRMPLVVILDISTNRPYCQDCQEVIKEYHMMLYDPEPRPDEPLIDDGEIESLDPDWDEFCGSENCVCDMLGDLYDESLEDSD